jgi:hypothetical protein
VFLNGCYTAVSSSVVRGSVHADHQHVLWYCYPDVLERASPTTYFHALYAEHEVLINIQTLEVMKGSFPRRAMVMVLEWANEHRDGLMEAWNQCVHMQPPQKIEPLS